VAVGPEVAVVDPEEAVGLEWVVVDPEVAVVALEEAVVAGADTVVDPEPVAQQTAVVVRTAAVVVVDRRTVAVVEVDRRIVVVVVVDQRTAVVVADRRTVVAVEVDRRTVVAVQQTVVDPAVGAVDRAQTAGRQADRARYRALGCRAGQRRGSERRGAAERSRNRRGRTLAEASPGCWGSCSSAAAAQTPSTA